MTNDAEAFDLDLALHLHNRDGHVISFSEVDEDLTPFPLRLSERMFLTDMLKDFMDSATDAEDFAEASALRERLRGWR